MVLVINMCCGYILRVGVAREQRVLRSKYLNVALSNAAIKLKYTALNYKGRRKYSLNF